MTTINATIRPNIIRKLTPSDALNLVFSTFFVDFAIPSLVFLFFAAI